jgi:EpsI family protein
MSVILDSPATAPAPDAATTPARRPGGRGLWARVGLAVALLAASFGVRAWQARGVDQALREGRKPPFPLAELPMNLGDWEGTSEELDPQIARNTGCTDYVFRTYQNRQTGSRVGVIVLYGPGEEVYIHSPETCYPAAGYGYGDGVVPRTVEAGGAKFPFLATVFVKGEGGRTERQEVYWTWGLMDRWRTTTVLPKQMERVAGMYKVHLTRVVGENELRPTQVAGQNGADRVASPSEDLLAQLMPWLDGRVKAAKAAARPAG